MGEMSKVDCVAFYHGWKFDVNGSCVDIPNEENGCELAKSRPVAAYPVIEQGSRLGPGWDRPNGSQLRREFDFCTLPSHVYTIKMSDEMQLPPGTLKEASTIPHISFLHKESAGGADVFGLGN